MFRVCVVESGGGLIQNEEFHLFGERFGNLNELLLAHTDGIDWGGGVLIQPDLAHQRFCVGIGLVPVDEVGLVVTLVADEDVLRDGEVRTQRQFLVNDDDSLTLGIVDGMEAGFFALVDDLPRVGPKRMNA